jgi:hypothetical protein
MQAQGWKKLILSSVEKAKQGDETQLDLLALSLEELDQAKQCLINEGFSCTGMSILEAVHAVSEVQSRCS